MTEALTADKEVQGHAIFIAEQGAADWLANEMPWGRGFVALEPSDLPRIFKGILEQAAPKQA